MTTLELYTKGAKVWIPHPLKVWEGAELIENYLPTGSTLKVQTEENGEVKTLTIKSKTDLPHLRNPAILIGENDLTSLSYLHEPAVLHNLQVRFCQHKSIYTYCGIVLVAINPYDDLPIYDVDTIQAYRGQAMGDLDPHIFAVSEEAYTKLEREEMNQSIIVSGESGAGKTVSAKYAMRYFATVGGSSTETQVEKKVLASSPILEAIGNAKTTRNDNSSRFGKFIELQFNNQYHIVGASMRTYLLEKSRVMFQAPDERNYHIFYQLCAAREMFPDLQLREQTYFCYLNQGNSPNIDGVNDLKTFEETKNALNILGFLDLEQTAMFRILAAVLYLGNVKILEQDQESCGIPDNDTNLEIMADLLEIDKDQISRWLCTKKLVSMRDTILKPMSVKQAIMSRDALAKHIYAELFNWIVFIINKTLETDIPRHKFIGVLDIYGFETFEINSFEQFCINYANEKLQQQFNLHVFKLEQEEYIKEGISWNMIEFYDNQPCIDLIESKMGILSLLDEECKMPKGSDGTWTEKLYLKCQQYKQFSKARFGTTAFVITHFADKVQYESNGFLDKNRDTVMEEQMNVIKYSKNDFIRRLFCENPQKQSLSVPGTKLKLVSAKPLVDSQKARKKTVGSQFRDSLNLLMSTLNATTPHYVRCIKPNDTKSAFDYNQQRAVQQLRACGVLETIRISATGFPSRWSYIEFFYRYRVLCKFKDIDQDDMTQTCERILKQHVIVRDMYKFGKTKIFFRAGQVAYLEKLRAEKLKVCCIIMQSTVRAFICRKKYLKIKLAVHNIQRYGRGYLARRLAGQIRRHRAAITIQRYMKGWVKRTQYKALSHLAENLQCYARGYLARRRFMEMKRNAKAVIIQKWIRGYLARKHFRQQSHYIVICQAAIRGFLARRQYKKLKIEARSIEHVKKLNNGLENKIISLQQKIEDINKHNNELKVHQNEVIVLRNKLTTFKALEIEIRNLNNLLIEKNKTINKLEEEIKVEREEKMDLVHEQEQYRMQTEMQLELFSEEISKLRKELDNSNEIVLTNQRAAEENLKVRIEEEKTLLLNEYDNDRQAHQKLLQEYHCLEQHCESLEKQMSSQQRFNTHLQNISDVSSISTIDETFISTTDIVEDHGYGSVRATVGAAASSEIDANDDNINLKPSNEEKEDVGLVLKLQHKLADTEREKERLQKRLDLIELSPKYNKAQNEKHDAIRIAQLEVANSKLKSQLYELSEGVEDGNEKNQLTSQLQILQDELERRSEEIIQLKSVLASQTDKMQAIVNCRSKTGEYINEDGELAIAYETQKIINRQLELELQDEKSKYKAYEKEFKLEIEKLREDNERQQRLLSANLSPTPKSQTEAFMDHEITRLTTENLDLRGRNDLLNETVRKLKKQINILSKKLKESGVDFEDTINEVTIKGDDTIEPNFKPRNRLPSIRRKEREYLGMFSYRKGEENAIIKKLVIDLKPKTADTLLPGLPAYILFMCIRHTDHVNDEDKVQTLLTAFISSVKKVIKKRPEDLETNVLWLSNTLRLVNIMKQYSGDKAFQTKSSAKQINQCLRNFDLTEYRGVIADTALLILQGILRNVEVKLQPMIVPAILEHEEISCVGGSGFKSRAHSSRDVESRDVKQNPVDTLLQELTGIYKMLKLYGVELDIISQIFKQVFYFICASSLNKLLLRKDLCHWAKGSHIKHNLSHFETWTREKQLEEQSIQATLQPIIQAAYLLQARKHDDDVASICEMCSALNSLQICKILNLYTPTDEYEERVPASFISKVQQKLEECPNNQEQQPLMDPSYKYTITFWFNPSEQRLEDIEIADVLKLPMLKKV